MPLGEDAAILLQPVIARQMEHLVGLSAAVCFTECESHSEPLHQLRR